MTLFDETENQRNSIKDEYTGDSFAFDAERVLKRDKRYLLFTGGGISKVHSLITFSLDGNIQ